MGGCGRKVEREYRESYELGEGCLKERLIIKESSVGFKCNGRLVM